MTQNKAAVLLLAHGSPDSPADVPEFIKNITGGRPVPESVLAEVAHRYSLIGKSPLTEITMAQARDMERELRMPVYVGMRNWKPFVADTVRDMMEAGIEQVLAICLAPQNSSTSVGLYKRALMAEMKPQISVQFVESWHEKKFMLQLVLTGIISIIVAGVVGWKTGSKETGFTVFGAVIATSQLVVAALVLLLPPPARFV